MLCKSNLPKYFWIEAINKTYFKENPPCTLQKKKPNIFYFKIFGCKYFILINGKDKLDKFDAKFDESIFLGYPSSSKVYSI